jgi:hypothetical protein
MADSMRDTLTSYASYISKALMIKWPATERDLILVRSYKGKALNLALIVSLAVGCLGPRVPDEDRPFFRLPRKMQLAELTTRPVEEQLDLYVAGITGVRPPRTDLGLVIGKQGPAIVPALLTRIRRVTNEHVKANLVWIMVGMPCTTGNADSIGAGLDSIRLEAARMRNPNAKSSAEHSLRLAEKRCHP